MSAVIPAGVERAAWVDAGNDAPLSVCRYYGITAPLFDIREPRLSPACSWRG